MFSIAQLLKFIIPKKKHNPLAIDVSLQTQLMFKNIISESSCGSLLRAEHKVWYFQKMISSAFPRQHMGKSSVAGALTPVSLSTCCFMTIKFPYNDKTVWLIKTRSPFPGEMVLVLKLPHVFGTVSMKTMTNWVPKKLSKSKSKPPDCVVKYLYTCKILLSWEHWGLNDAFLFYWNYRHWAYVLLHSIFKYLPHHVIQILCL